MTILLAKIGAALVALTLLLSSLLVMQVQDLSLGSVTVGNEYNATSTGEFINDSSTKMVGVIKARGGVIGQITVTDAAAGSINFYNATTSNVDLRDSSQSTSCNAAT